MRQQTEEQKHRLSLTLTFAGIVFVFLFLTMLIVVVAIIVLLHEGTLQLGNNMPRAERLIAVIAIISLAAGTALAATVGRLPLRPINEIVNAMNRLAAGDFRTRLHFDGPFSKLAVTREFSDSFNTMASELESTEMLRSDFVNNFSHEFKTPIVSIAGFAKLLKKGRLSEEERLEYLSIIEDESLRLSQMATNVLNLTKVENQTILSGVTVYNLSEQLRNCVLLLEDKWTRKNLEMVLDFTEHEIAANEELLKLVWVNLLDNAIKFSIEGGTVAVSILSENGDLVVSIVNYGSDIPQESMSRIFQKFYQADESHASEGNGIGLAIVQKVTALHQGEISVDSRDGITRFTVHLPAQQHAKILKEQEG